MRALKKYLSLIVAAGLLLPVQLSAQEGALEPIQFLELFGTTASVQSDAAGSFINPALGATMPFLSTQSDFWVFADTRDLSKVNQWGYFYADPMMQFGIYSRPLQDNSTQTDMHFGISGGNRSYAFGLANISLFNEKRSVYDYFNSLQAGILLRPIREASLGVTYTQQYTNNTWNLLVDGGIRPLGTNLITLFGAWSASNSFTDPDSQKWLAGLSLVPAKGFELYGKYVSSGALTLGMSLRVGGLGFGTSIASENIDFSGPIQAGAGISFATNKEGYAMVVPSAQKTYVELSLWDLSASPDLFKSSSSLLVVLQTIDSAKKDPNVEGLILNTASLSASQSDQWELRKALEEFKTSGKKIIAFVESPNFDVYALATVADRIVMDSQGTISFDGYVAGRGYFKHTLDKLGIGFRELRYFTYKSAAESYSRDSLSPADREQYEAYLDSTFRTVKDAILMGRKLSEDQFTQLLEENFLLSPREAQKAALVDYLGREDAIRSAIKDLSGKELAVLTYGNASLSLFQKNSNPLMAFASYRTPTDQQDVWSEPPHLAIVYANGSTSLEGGMNARSLSKIIENLGNDPGVKGIVLRVDSPGGDAIAADYVAEAVKKAKNQKPVYVSMGSVAGSGGYWVSMYGSEIYATPYTITGSIGVIASWFYDAGLNNKLGLSIDLIKRGSHADLNAGILLPYRDLSPQEVEEYHQWILELYDDFVSRVAAGRSMPKERVQELAQGRIYAGEDAAKNGLIDGIQGLAGTLSALKKSLNIPEDAELIIDEYPYPNPFAAFLASLNQVSMPRSRLALLAAKIARDMKAPQMSPLALSSFTDIMAPRFNNNGKVQAVMSLESLELLYGAEGAPERIF